MIENKLPMVEQIISQWKIGSIDFTKVNVYSQVNKKSLENLYWWLLQKSSQKYSCKKNWVFGQTCLTCSILKRTRKLNCPSGAYCLEKILKRN